MKILMYYVHRFFDRRKLKKACKEANSKFKHYGDRFYVLGNTDRKLYVLNKRMFKAMRADGYIHGDMFVRDMEEQCFYHTPYRNGHGQLTPEKRKKKLQAYDEFCLRCRMKVITINF